MVSGVTSQQDTTQATTQSTGQVQGHQGHHHRTASGMYSKLSSIVGDGNDSSSSNSSSNGITQDQLTTALQTAQQNGNTQETDFLQHAIKDFSKLSGGANTITQNSLTQAFSPSSTQSTNTQSMGSEPQDPSSVTAAQLQPPIDISV